MANLDLTHIIIDEAGPWVSWSGRLLIDGADVAEVAGDTDSAFKVTSLSSGITPSRWAELELEVVLSMPTRDEAGSTISQNIASLCIDLIAFEWVSRNLTDSLKREVIGIIPGENASIASVPIPDGGSMGAAKSHLLTAEPEAIVLNDLSLDEATIRYIAVASSI